VQVLVFGYLVGLGTSKPCNVAPGVSRRINPPRWINPLFMGSRTGAELIHRLTTVATEKATIQIKVHRLTAVATGKNWINHLIAADVSRRINPPRVTAAAPQKDDLQSSRPHSYGRGYVGKVGLKLRVPLRDYGLPIRRFACHYLYALKAEPCGLWHVKTRRRPVAYRQLSVYPRSS